jgi:hypothetical protein
VQLGWKLDHDTKLNCLSLVRVEIMGPKDGGYETLQPRALDLADRADISADVRAEEAG